MPTHDFMGYHFANPCYCIAYLYADDFNQLCVQALVGVVILISRPLAAGGNESILQIMLLIPCPGAAGAAVANCPLLSVNSLQIRIPGSMCHFQASTQGAMCF